MTGGGDRNKLSLNSGVSYIFTHTHTLKKKKIPKLMLLQITNGDKQQNNPMCLYQWGKAFQVFPILSSKHDCK